MSGKAGEIMSDTSKLIWKGTAFLLHFSVSIYLVDLFFQNKECKLFSSQSELMHAGTDFQAYHNDTDMWPMFFAVENVSLIMDYNQTVDHFAELNKTMPFEAAVLVSNHADDALLGSVNSVIFLMALFEWITAGFALHYLSFQMFHMLDRNIRDINLDDAARLIVFGIDFTWFFIFPCICFSLMPKSEIPINNALCGIMLPVIGMVVVTSDHIIRIKNKFEYDDVNMGIKVRYVEYSLTAPILMLALMSVSINSFSWVPLSSFLCMMVTNLLGVPIHEFSSQIGKNGEYVKLTGQGDQTPEMNRRVVENMELVIGMLLAVSWITFCTSWVGFFIQLPHVWDRLPVTPQVMMVLIPLLFASFGIAGTWQYIVQNSSFLSVLDSIYDMLSILVKLFLVFSITTGSYFRDRYACDY